MDSKQFREAAKQLVDYVCDYLDNIRDRPVLPSVEPFYLEKQLPDSAPEDGEPWESVFNDIEKLIMPGMTHWHSPRFHAYFPTANSYPSILADILTGALGCIGFTWIASPACTELEMSMMDWLGKMLNLPEEFLFSSRGNGGGVIQGTASEATLVTMLGARSQALAKLASSCSSNQSIPLDKLVAYCSTQSHSSVERAGLLAAITIRALETDENLSLRGETLEKAIKEDKAKGLIPFLAVATLGTTNSCAFDNIVEIGEICQKEDIWLHIDAAYAGSAFICPEYRHYLNGVEKADSFNMNPHKWMLINFDCSALWLKNRHLVANAFNVDPVYLKHDKQGQIPDYRHLQIPLGRRFRSLKMWFVLRLYGVKGLQEYIRKHVRLAHEFEAMLKTDSRFEIEQPVVLGLVTFRLKGSDELNEKYSKAINDRKQIHITPSRINGRYTLRFAVCARTTEQDDIKFAWNEFQTVASQILKENEQTTK
ncbi:aromatic-L-amino-acid decarboxylase [Tetranychus urticae]|uniref:Aromatic-L-amino-acid decarboxylase n=1 Tax=Tetranychus urticae TaxID=32264 RepID=T1KUP2_TETUR|nr:aromatic-L-amino-acid decarboxylase [Tetranychus urticae]XP_025017719.1 aromatic-L-amino-acid decarboxylase [Tetranychus urticae]XP_025017720.1 aromatic-L-amino-acid decarboxylase [Tetranychus urticae]XP_025017721.1 aromatic-L-amino-acid decarboxylase [Tetranychus urticae]XP_025017722.1 aromatic-L-amino-acid decarboxylase [Tetranychus urticae]